MTRQRSPRGQAVVETALAVLVIVTVVMFGIHFAEVGYASVKVHEAAAFAMWKGTGERVNLPTGTTFGGYPGAAAASANGPYDDLDYGRGGSGARYALTELRGGVNVTCQANGALGGVINPSLGPFPLTGGMACGATATLAPYQIPSMFAQESGNAFFKAVHKKRTYPVCGVGRALNGNCGGRLGILLGDWAIADADDVPGNGPYESVARQIWSDNKGHQGNAAQDLAIKYADYDPSGNLPFMMKTGPTEHLHTVLEGAPGSFLGGVR